MLKIPMHPFIMLVEWQGDLKKLVGMGRRFGSLNMPLKNIKTIMA
jgi:hypothetical protein